MPDEVNNGKVAIVTGSCRAVGRAIASEFAKAEYSVIINGLDEMALNQAAEDIAKIVGKNNRVVPIPGDISEEQASKLLLEKAVQLFGRIDVLVNNAELLDKPKKINGNVSNESSPTSYFTLEEYEFPDSNLKGAYLCTKEAVKRMLNKDEKNYSIINISSCHESISQSDSETYEASKSGINPFTSSKAGVESLTKTLALELADIGIRVNGIAPGIIATNTNQELLDNKEKKKQKESEIAIHRMGQPEEIAKVALFLASNNASYITGTILDVDGGLSLNRPTYILEHDLEQD
jgi:NAD(P)-dependent dehydrogenase (short-subunit alcohol dehydrogenase family)